MAPDIDASGAASATGDNRRIHPRLTASDLRGLVTARLKYGDDVRLIDLSVGGVLIEAPGKMEPHSNVVFEFAGPGSTILVPSRTLRVTRFSQASNSGRFEGAFAFKRPLAIAELLKDPVAAWHKVAARYRDGRVIQGYTHDFQPSKRGLSISPTPFSAVSRPVALSELESIFFLRDDALGGVESAPPSSHPLGRRIAVTLLDGEVLVGTTLNYRRDGNGFFIHPSDLPNTLRIFVTPWAIRTLKFL